VRPADQVAVAERGPGPVPAPVTALFDVVLLAGSPRRLTLLLPADVATEDVIDVAGEPWMIADVRAAEHGPSQLICIYPE
jgi:hypothetical protein